MGPKLIIVPFGGYDRELPTLEYAFGIAELYNGHTEIWHISPDPLTAIVPFAPYGTIVYPEKSVAELEELNENNRKMAEQKLQILKDKQKVENISFHTAIGDEGDILSVQGRLADLIVLYRDPDTIGFVDQAYDILSGSGRPVLLVPPGNNVKKFTGKTLIAWNGSLEAARAVAFALPFLSLDKVTILTEPDDEALKPELSAENLAQYLKQHDITVDILSDINKKTDLATCILESAKNVGAEMIVMGAYSHSRMREYIFGGVTKSMLQNADLPVFMAH